MLDFIHVKMPILSVHGNHDNPTGKFNASPIDMLAGRGLLTHFGRIRDLQKIEIKPVTLKKGKTIINIFGIGSVKDEWLNAMIEQDRVRFLTPPNIEDSFNILVLHQNRTKRGPSDKSFFHEKNIPQFIDFVLWGHEHDDRLSLEYCNVSDCFITQENY